MYKNYEVKIIKNPSIYDQDLCEVGYDYVPDEELQIFSESDEILFNLKKNWHFKSFECIDNFLIVDIDECHKFTLDNIYIDLDTFEVYEELFKYNNHLYRRLYNKDKKMIELLNFIGTLYGVKYFFENVNTIIDLLEFDLHQFDTTKDTLLMAIFKLFGKNVDNNSQINIEGFTWGMSCRDIGVFKNILRDHTKTIEKQLNDTLFGHINPQIHKIYDIVLTIYYKDNNIDKFFKIKLECKNKKELFTSYIYGEFDDDAKLCLI